MLEHPRNTFEAGNYGVQVGQSSGSITTNFYSQAERPESPPKPTSTVPFCRDVNFVERGDLLQQIEQACSGPASRAALVGLGGVGKSQLAIEYVYRVKDRISRSNQEIWLLWVHASTKARVQESFKTIADVLKLADRDQPSVDTIRLVERWLSNEHNGKWFMVLDSADDINVLYDTKNAGQAAASSDEKRPIWTYLPQSANGSILVTTRNRELAMRLTGDHKNIIYVGPMDPSHALTLLVRRCEDDSDMDAGRELVKELEFIPLAISQAAAYIQQRWPRITVVEYLQEIRKTEKNKCSLLNRDAGDLRRDRSASNSIITTFQISFDHIRSERRSATDLLSLMSFFNCQGIPDDLVRPEGLERLDNGEDADDEIRDDTESSSEDDEVETTGSETADSHCDLDEQFEEDIATLRNYCLIKINATGDTFEMHALVQLSMEKWLAAHGEAEIFKANYLGRMARACPRTDRVNRERRRKLLPHAEITLNHRPEDEESLQDWALVLFNGGYYATEQGRHATARKLTEEALAAIEKIYGKKSFLTLNAMSLLGCVYLGCGFYKEAESMFSEGLGARKRVFGADHPDTLTSMNLLARTYWRQDRLEEAEELQVQHLEASKRIFGTESPETLLSMDDLALIYRDQGRLEEAEELRVQQLEAYKRILGTENPKTLLSMDGLALIYRDQGRLEEAKELIACVLGVAKRVLGGEHLYTLTAMNTMALIWESLGRIDDAIRLMEECAQKTDRVSGPGHPHTKRVLSNLSGMRSHRLEHLS
ncbi:P-loop containing nucleoside triphosphate hydrolase protein [Hypoxylon sp. FL0543]|nr:P-loop containing nucleoside triphosphate hydrolase protein [Hypoxylon sp. FL0543]